jgi:hypothetical protein
MSEPLSSPPVGPPPRKPGMSTMTIVLIVLGVVFLLCCGACGTCFYFGSGDALQVRDEVMNKVNTNTAVKDALGEPLTPNYPHKINMQNAHRDIEFEISGPKGKATVHAAGEKGPNGFEASVITVTPSGGKAIDVNAKNDPTDLEFNTGDEMESTE